MRTVNASARFVLRFGPFLVLRPYSFSLYTELS